MKKIISLVLALVMVSAVAVGCGCKHEWADADCTTPKICKLCSLAEGEPAGHNWLDATCTAAKVCKNCDATEGEALGHDWQEATTEAPTTCARCKVTEGSKIDTDPRFTTESTKEFYGKWTCDVDLPAEIVNLTGYMDSLPSTMTMEFGKAGELKLDFHLNDYDGFIAVMKTYTKDVLIDSISGGYQLSADELDALMIDYYDLTVDEYVDSYIDSIDFDDLFDYFIADMVYYVGQNGLYTADSWYDEFECSEYTFDGDTLIIDEEYIEEGKPLVWKKVID